MSYSTCIRHPESSHFIQLHKWALQMCSGNHCAAMLISFFAGWHNWKLLHDDYYKKFNNIAEMHGDGRPHIENAYLFFSTEELVEGLIGLFGKKAITDSLALLVSLDVISIHKNPNPRYHFDKTKYFRFYPEVCNQWLRECYEVKAETQDDTQVVDNFDSAEIDDRSAKNALPSRKNSRPSCQNGQAITYNTNNNTNQNNQSPKPLGDFCSSEKNSSAIESSVKPVIAILTEKGMSPKRFYSDAIEKIYLLQQQGATVNHFVKAYDLAERATQSGDFGINYLAKIVHDLLQDKNPRKTSPPKTSNKHKPVYEHDFSVGLHWMGDLVEGSNNEFARSN